MFIFFLLHAMNVVNHRSLKVHSGEFSFTLFFNYLHWFLLQFFKCKWTDWQTRQQTLLVVSNVLTFLFHFL